MQRQVLWMTLACCAVIGCGKSNNLGTPVAVTGQVQLNGKPLPDVTVGFSALSKGTPAKYRYVSAVTDSDGSYSISDVHPGEYMVLLSEADVVAPDAEGAGDVKKVEAVAGNPALAKYSTQSPLRAIVSETATTHDFKAVSQ